MVTLACGILFSDCSYKYGKDSNFRFSIKTVYVQTLSKECRVGKIMFKLSYFLTISVFSKHFSCEL